MADTVTKVLPRWRCEPRGCSDKNLIAVFLREATAQDAFEKLKLMYGQNVTASIVADGE